VFGGMILASFIGIFAIPPLYVTFQALREKLRPGAGPHGAEPPPGKPEHQLPTHGEARGTHERRPWAPPLRALSRRARAARTSRTQKMPLHQRIVEIRQGITRRSAPRRSVCEKNFCNELSAG